MAFMLMSSHSIGLYDMDMLHWYMLHASSERSGTRTVIPVVDMLLKKQRAQRSQQPPRSGRSSGESTNRGPTRLQHCAPIAHKHSNTVKQKGRMRAALSGAGRHAHLMVAAGEDP